MIKEGLGDRSISNGLLSGISEFCTPWASHNNKIPDNERHAFLYQRGPGQFWNARWEIRPVFKPSDTNAFSERKI